MPTLAQVDSASENDCVMIATVMPGKVFIILLVPDLTAWTNLDKKRKSPSKLRLEHGLFINSNRDRIKDQNAKMSFAKIWRQVEKDHEELTSKEKQKYMEIALD